MAVLRPVPYKEREKRRFRHSIIQPVGLLMAAVIIFAVASFMIQFFKPAKIEASKAAHQASPVKPPAGKPSAEKVAAADINNDPAINQYLTSLHFNGAVLVVKDHKVVMNKGFGYADFEQKIPNNSKTVFYIGSITKVFISTAIMQLQERKLLNVNDHLSKYLPDFPHANEIKLYNLLTHTSGIPEHNESSQQISHADLMKKIAKGRLLFPPGTQWNYSDSNYSILAYIVERVSKEPLDTYVKDHIFDRAGMQYTGFGNSFYDEPFPAKGYKFKKDHLISPSLPDMSQLFGCGDIYTTPYDMYLFDKALYSGKLLKKRSLQQFLTPFKHNYAFGLYNDPGSYSDHGVLPGWNTLNSFSKSGSMFVILFSNVQNGVKSFGLVNNHIYMLLSK